MFDPERSTRSIFPPHLQDRYSFHSYRGAAVVLKEFFPNEFERLVRALSIYRTRAFDICMPGGSEGRSTKVFKKIAKRCGYRDEVTLRTLSAWRASSHGATFLEWRSGNDDHTHKVDFWSDRVSVDFEWNSKDQTYDRDLLAIRSFYDVGAVSLGVIVTRDFSHEFARLFPNLEVYDPERNYTAIQLGTRFRCRGESAIQKQKDGKLLSLASKMGASTTGMHKLRSRLLSGRGGAAPILAIGITDYNLV